jgi:hypothetical protein
MEHEKKRGRPAQRMPVGPGTKLAQWLHENWDTQVSRSQDEIAQELGYKRPNIISMWKTGRTPIPRKHIRYLAQLMKVDYFFVFELWLDQVCEGDAPNEIVTLLRVASAETRPARGVA